jgi:cytochrome c
VVGPSWQEIGAKYAGGKKTPEALAQAIRQGGSGTWGAVPMPAQAHVPEKDALTLARWLLAPRD